VGKVRCYLEADKGQGRALLAWILAGRLEELEAHKKSTPKKPMDQTLRK